MGSPGHPRPTGLAPGTVLVVDEAGMLGTRPLARLLAHTQAAGGKLVLVGDHRQLPELDAGGAFRALARELSAASLTQNRRQAQSWKRAALGQLRDGDTDLAVDAYLDAGRVQRAATGADARAELAAAWWSAATVDGADEPSAEVVMLAVRRTDVGELNLRARAHMAAAGRLVGPTLTVPAGPYAERSFAAGDLVVARRNHYPAELINGERVVSAVHAERAELTVRFGEREALVPAEYVADGGLDHGYALTIHQAQGMTCERALLLGSDAL